MSGEEAAAKAALEAEQATLLEVAAEGGEISEETDARLGEIETALERLADRPVAFSPEDVARAGVFVSIAHDGSLRIERGWVRPEDEAPILTDGIREIRSSDVSFLRPGAQQMNDVADRNRPSTPKAVIGGEAAGSYAHSL